MMTSTILDLPDIDIDVLDRKDVLNGLDYVSASMVIDEELKKHPTGVFFQNIPTDPKTGFASLPSGKKSGDYAAGAGFYKIDLINNTAYKYVNGPEHLDEIVNREVPWDLFMQPDVVEKLQHIGNHFDIMAYYPPKTVEELAIIIALIRPAKRYLIGAPWEEIVSKIWVVEPDGYRFKKSHAISYALMITVQLHSMIDAGIIA